MVDWETIEVPRGSFIGWGGKQQVGQKVVGRVLAYDMVGGTDFNGNPCPQVDIELTEAAESYNKALDRFDYAAGDFVCVTGGTGDLKKALQRAEPKTGDLIQMELTGVDTLANGNTAKRHQVKIARGQNKPPPTRQQPIRGGAAGFDQDDEPPPF